MLIEQSEPNAKMAASGMQIGKISDGRVTMSDIVVALGEEKRWFLGIWVAGSVAALAVVLALPRMYSASTVLMPPQQQSGSSAALAQFGMLASLAGGTVGVRSPDEMYVSFLKTQRIQSALVDKLKLQEHYQVRSKEDARLMLISRVQVSSDKKSGLITVSADDEDAAFAAQLANAHVDELGGMLSSLAVTEAQQRRLFYASQVAKAQDDLRNAELVFRKEQERNGFVVSQVLAESGAKAQIELQSQIAAKEIQLQSMGRFMTSQSYEVQRVTSELAALRQQLRTLQNGRGDAGAEDSEHLSAVKAYRDMRAREVTLEALMRQLEVAKLDEAKEGPALQQVDVAVAPEYPSKPKRAYLLIASSMLFFLFGSIVGFARWRIRQQKTDNSESLAQRFRRAWL